MSVLVGQCLVELQAAYKTPITLQNKNSATNNLVKLWNTPEQVSVYNTTKKFNYEVSTIALDINILIKTLKYIFLENVKSFGVVIFKTSQEKQVYVVQCQHNWKL